MRRQQKSNKSRRNDKRKPVVEETVYIVSEIAPDPFQLSTCCVCGGVEDEDLIILCDGPGCNSEVHMYCLTPVMTAVPDGDWFCGSCDPLGTTANLQKYFAAFDDLSSRLSPASKAGYNEYLHALQQRVIPLGQWAPSPNAEIVRSEFTSSAIDLIGCIVRLSVTPTEYHTGRILNRRFDATLGVWEHYVHFKSGGEGRNAPYERWLRLDEHPCLVGGTVRWARHGDFPWWPALECHQSGTEILLRRHQEGDAPRGARAARRGAGDDPLWYYFFGDESYAWLSRSDERYVAPFFQRSREARVYAGKRQHVAYALACGEREEQLSARRAFQLRSDTAKASSGALVDGYTTCALKRMVDFPAAFHRLLGASRMKSSADGASAVNDAAAATSSDELWGLYCKHNRSMLQYEYCRAVHPPPQLSAETAEVVIMSHAEVDTVAKSPVASACTSSDATTSAAASSSSSTAAPGTLTAARAESAPLKVDFEQHRFLALDRVYLTAECGLRLHDRSGGPVDFLDFGGSTPVPDAVDSQPLKKRRASAGRNYRSLAAGIDERVVEEEPEEATVVAAEEEKEVVRQFPPLPAVRPPAVTVEPFSFSKLLFCNYKAEVEKKQEELEAQLAREAQDRLEKKAQREARKAEKSINPWVVDGEDLTRKSSRLSYSGSSASQTTGSASSETESGVAGGGGAEEVVTTEESAVSVGGPSGPGTSNKAAKRSTRKSRQKAQEEEAYREFLASAENQPRLLTDLDRAEWVGAVVMYLPTQQAGRVADYRSGWAVVRTLYGELNGRPYQLEVVERNTDAYAAFEDAEMWALCEEGEGQDASSAAAAGTVAHSAPQELSNDADHDYLRLDMTADSGAWFEDEADEMGMDTSGVGITNDAEYDQFLLRQFDVQVTQEDEGPAFSGPAGGGVPGSADARPVPLARAARMGQQAAREQQLKPSRTKLIDVVPQVSEAERQRRLQAVEKSRMQVQKLLQPTALNNANASSAPIPRAITIARKPSIEDAEDAVPVVRYGERKPTAAPPSVIRLNGTAPPLAKPSFLRGTSNNWRRPELQRQSFPPVSQKQPAATAVTAVSATAPVTPRVIDAFGRQVPASDGVGQGQYSPRADQRGDAAARPATADNNPAPGTAASSDRSIDIRDPRLRARLEREALKRSVGPPSTTYGVTRETDYRSERNSSSAVRTMKANIDLLQASCGMPEPGSEEPVRASDAPNARRVTFNVRHNALSSVILDDSILDISDPGDIARFSPVSCDSRDSEPEEVNPRFSIRAIDEVDYVRAPARSTSAVTIPQQPAMNVLTQGSTAGMDNGQPARKSRFSAPAVHQSRLDASHVVVDLTADDAIAGTRDSDPRTISAPAAVAPASDTSNKPAAKDLEPGECEDDEPQRTDVADCAAASTKRTRTRFSAPNAPLESNSLPTPNMPMPPLTFPAVAVVSGAVSVVPATPFFHDSALDFMQPDLKAQPSSRRPIVVIDRTYPQFNHTEYADAAIAHMDVVMPACMACMNELLASDAFIPNIGCGATRPAGLAPQGESERRTRFHAPEVGSFPARLDDAAPAAPVRRSRFSEPGANNAQQQASESMPMPALVPTPVQKAERASRWGHRAESSGEAPSRDAGAPVRYETALPASHRDPGAHPHRQDAGMWSVQASSTRTDAVQVLPLDPVRSGVGIHDARRAQWENSREGAPLDYDRDSHRRY